MDVPSKKEGRRFSWVTEGLKYIIKNRHILDFYEDMVYIIHMDTKKFNDFMRELRKVEKSIKKKCGARPAGIEFWFRDQPLELDGIGHFHIIPDVIIHFRKLPTNKASS